MCFIRFLLLGAVRVDPDTETGLRRTKKHLLMRAGKKKTILEEKTEGSGKTQKKKKSFVGKAPQDQESGRLGQ